MDSSREWLLQEHLINDPDVILADEPIGNLDSKTGTEVMELLREINIEKGKTIVQVTHSAEAAKYGQRIIYVKRWKGGRGLK